MTTWYVRPNTTHSSSRNGTSYANAWGGWSEIVWGSGGVTALDILYICGAHSYSSITTVGNHTGTSGNEVTIRGDFTGDPGSLSYATGTYLATRSHTRWLNLSISGVSRCMLSGTLTNHVMTNVSFFGGINPIFGLFASTGNNYTGISFISCVFNGGGAAGASGSAAAFDWFCGTAAAVSTVTRLTFDSCVFRNVNPLGNARGVVGLRTQENVDVSSIVTDLLFINNTFENCKGYALECADGHSYGAASPLYGLFKGARVLNNKVINQTLDATGILGGAFSIFGFGQSTTSGFGVNLVKGNHVDGAGGQAGGANICYGTSIVEDNIFKNLTTNSIDACGILIDIGARDCIVRRNYVENLSGKAGVANSGAGVMILDAENTKVFSNVIKNAKCGVFLGSMTAGRTNSITNNTFIDCIDFGVFLSSAAARPNLTIRNNIFSSKVGSTTVAVSDTVGGLTGENYNAFVGTFTAFGLHTRGANSITFLNEGVLLLDENKRPTTNSPVIGIGTHLGYVRDYDGKQRPRPPSIGAYDVAKIKNVN